MKQLLSITSMLFIFSLLSFSQSDTPILKGKVTDRETNEGIAFVSIGIEGTYTGTASNPDGNFELRIPAEHRTKNLYFSAIGYKNVSFPISDFLQKQEILIVLIPHSYAIDEVDVAAESRVLQRILRTASECIPQNYISKPLNLKFYFEERQSVDNAPSKTSRAIVDLFDAKGYAAPSWTDAFKSRNYRISEAQNPSPVSTFSEAPGNLDEMLEMDVVRLSNTILNPKLLNDFKLKMEDKSRLNGDSVWIISYEAKKPDLSRTGSFYPTRFSGKIYISHSGYAVLRNEISLSEGWENPQGRSLAIKSNPRTKIQMNITTGYQKVQGQYVLAFIDSEKQFTSAEKQSVYESGKVLVLNVQTNNIQALSGREYYADVKPNETFWKNFTIPSK